MAAKHVFADTHPHSSFKYAYNNYDLWKSINLPHILVERLTGMTAYTQSDFRRMALGGVQIAFVGLHAIEQRMNFLKEPLDSIIERADRITFFMTKIPATAVDFMKTSDYDHYRQVLKEKDLLLSNQLRERKLHFGKLKYKRCKYEIVHNYQRIKEIIELNKTNKRQFTIAVLFTIEGIYNIGRGHLDLNGPNRYNVSDERLLQRIDNLKGLDNEEGNGWKFSPLWISLGHIFHNGIYGYPQPLKQGFKKIFEYSESPGDPGSQLNEGMTDLGKKIIMKMLSIGDGSNSQGRRVLVDIKHLSTKSRAEYYEIIDAHHAAHPDDIIPVVMSHGAVNGKASLDQDYNPEDTDKEQKDSTGFNPWSINLYDDEILRIHNTRGLVGIMLDERIISGKEKIKKTKGHGDKKWGKIFADQIEHIVKTVYNSDVPDKEKIWDCISIGSDFDGQINPTNAFHTSKQFPCLRKALARELAGSRFAPYREGILITTLLNKISHDNALDFLRRHYDH